MSSLRESLLAECIKNKLIAIQKSEQIYEKLSKWESRALVMDEKQIEKIADLIAAKVENYFSKERATGNQPSPEQITEKIKRELEKI